MKNKIALFAFALVAFLFTGCASRTIEAASTKLEVKSPSGRSVAFVFPKELDARKFDLTVDPATGFIVLKSDAITTSSQGVIDSAGKAQAQAMSDMAKLLDKLTSLAPIGVPSLAPAAR